MDVIGSKNTCTCMQGLWQTYISAPLSKVVDKAETHCMLAMLAASNTMYIWNQMGLNQRKQWNVVMLINGWLNTILLTWVHVHQHLWTQTGLENRNECVSKQIRCRKAFTLQMNAFITSNEHVLCWRRTILAMEMNAFCARDKHFSAGDKHVENPCLNFSYTHS